MIYTKWIVVTPKAMNQLRGSLDVKTQAAHSCGSAEGFIQTRTHEYNLSHWKLDLS